MRKRRMLAALAAVAAVAGGSTMGAQAYAGQRDDNTRSGEHSARLDRIFVIMLENHSQSSVIGNENAPFINRLAKHNVMADHYYGVTHPSMPNYIAAIAGDNFGIQDDEDENVVNLDRPNLVDQLEAHDIRWAAYMDTLPPDKLARYWPKRDDGSDIKLYAKKHNAFVLFDSVKNNRTG